MNSIIDACRSRSAVVGRYIGRDDLTLDGLIDIQREKLCKNRKITPLRSPEDFYRSSYEYVRKRLGEDTAREAETALRTGAVNFADHHGGLYSPQSFQGDLLFGRLLEKEGCKARVTPVLSTGIVALGNSTYARGIMCFCSPTSPVRLPLYLKSRENKLVMLAEAYDRTMLDKLSAEAQELITDKKALATVMDIINTIYSKDEILDKDRYGDQLLLIGRELSERALKGRRPPVIGLEAEEILPELFINDLRDRDSLLSIMITDPAVRKNLGETFVSDGCPLSSLMFRGIDKSGRKFVLDLGSDGVLRGTDMKGNGGRFAAEPERLIKMFAEKTVIPSGYLFAVMLAWTRGITWYGGIFQAEYLPKWQKLTVEVLKKSGRSDLADAISGYDCSGYISGPVCMLSQTGGSALNAGPVELIGSDKETDLTDLFKTSVRDSHLMGMFEFYSDLVSGKDKKEGWYETIGKYCCADFKKNIL